MTFPLPNLSNDLTGRVALVTGASSGLGWRFAKVLAKQGAKVAVSGRRLERLEALVAEIKADGTYQKISDTYFGQDVSK